MTIKMIDKEIQTSKSVNNSSIYGIFLTRPIQYKQEYNKQRNIKKTSNSIIKNKSHLIYIGKTSNIKLRGIQHYNMIKKITQKVNVDKKDYFVDKMLRKEYISFVFQIGQLNKNKNYVQSQFMCEDQQFFYSLTYKEQIKKFKQHIDNLGLNQEYKATIYKLITYIEQYLCKYSLFINSYNSSLNPIYDNYIIMSYLYCVFGGMFKMIEINQCSYEDLSKLEFKTFQLTQTPANHFHKKRTQSFDSCNQTYPVNKQYKTSNQQIKKTTHTINIVDQKELITQQDIQILLNNKFHKLLQTINNEENTILISILIEGELQYLMQKKGMKPNIFQSFQQLLSKQTQQNPLHLYTYCKQNSQCELKKMGDDVYQTIKKIQVTV